MHSEFSPKKPSFSNGKDTTKNVSFSTKGRNDYVNKTTEAKERIRSEYSSNKSSFSNGNDTTKNVSFSTKVGPGKAIHFRQNNIPLPATG